MKHRWEVTTSAGVRIAGTDANVYLSLQADKRDMANIHDTDDDSTWEQSERRGSLMRILNRGV